MLEPRVLLRYSLYQLPGIGVVGGLLWMTAAYYDAIAGSTALILLALWIAKDIALYPLTWRAYQSHGLVGDERLVGRDGITLTDLNPDGKVRLGPEIWNARSTDGSAIPQDTPIRVTGSEGLRLIVTRRN